MDLRGSGVMRLTSCLRGSQALYNVSSVLEKTCLVTDWSSTGLADTCLNSPVSRAFDALSLGHQTVLSPWARPGLRWALTKADGGGGLVVKEVGATAVVVGKMVVG